ncbi:MAG: MBL fold metallo-hydrolase [Deltaproteobacteria bacterium]|nr:MBL fold metallo-hydrolase [Candidatus Zymogenaceae bacterium]
MSTKRERMHIEGFVYQVAGDGVTNGEDASAFLLALPDPILIDTGAGRSAEKIIENIASVGVEPTRINIIVLTHNHIDHIGGVPVLKERLGASIVMHELDADAVRNGDNSATAATMYGVDFPPTPVDRTFSGDTDTVNSGDVELVLLHTPGHTPGSISPYVVYEGTTILFAQDVHGPFLPAFGSDIYLWRESMEKLLDLQPDILCEGHFGIYRPGKRARAYITGYLDRYARY